MWWDKMRCDGLRCDVTWCDEMSCDWPCNLMYDVAIPNRSWTLWMYITCISTTWYCIKIWCCNTTRYDWMYHVYWLTSVYMLHVIVYHVMSHDSHVMWHGCFMQCHIIHMWCDMHQYHTGGTRASIPAFLAYLLNPQSFLTYTSDISKSRDRRFSSTTNDTIPHIQRLYVSVPSMTMAWGDKYMEVGGMHAWGCCHVANVALTMSSVLTHVIFSCPASFSPCRSSVWGEYFHSTTMRCHAISCHAMSDVDDR